MFYRNRIEELKAWAAEKDRKPLVLRGARQVGKTTLIDMFAAEFDQYIYLNLEKESERKLFDGSFNIPNLLDALFYLKDARKDKAKTLLFIDEIQNSPHAVATLRYLYEEAKHLYVIAAGSLLESMIDQSISFPVGRVDYLALRPCSFDEFLLALDERKSFELLQEGYVPGYAHEKMLDLFKTYTIIGGMPEVLSDYAEHRDMVRLGRIYDSLIVSYQDDVEKYARNQTILKAIQHIIDSAFQYAGSRITFEKFGKSNYRSREMGEAFRTLEKAMLLQLMFPVTKTSLPVEEKIGFAPKLLMLDTGLVNHSAGLKKTLLMSKSIDQAYQGRIAEHITGQMLLNMNSSVRSRLHFWVPKKSNAQAEVDFVLPWKDMLIPIEVKSGHTGTLRSLHRFMDEAPHALAIRVYSGTLKVEDARTINGKGFRLVNLPFYLLGEIEKILATVKV